MKNNFSHNLSIDQNCQWVLTRIVKLFFNNCHNIKYKPSEMIIIVGLLTRNVTLYQWSFRNVYITSTKFVHRCVSWPILKRVEKIQKFCNIYYSFIMFVQISFLLIKAKKILRVVDVSTTLIKMRSKPNCFNPICPGLLVPGLYSTHYFNDFSNFGFTEAKIHI